MLKYRGRIGEELIDAGLVTQAQVEAALSMQREKGGKTVENLVALGFLSVEGFVKFQKSRPGMPSLDLGNYSLPADVISLIPREFAIKHQLIPIDKMGKALTVGMSFPLDEAALHSLSELTGLRPRPVLCSIDDIRSAIQKYYSPPDKNLDVLRNGKDNSLAADLRLGALPAMIRSIDSLPGLPETVRTVREALGDDSISVGDIAAVIRRDPPVAAKLIGVANSAALALSQRVESVDMAVGILGLRETYALVASLAVREQFQECGEYFKHQFWDDSQNCATAAVAVTRARGQRQTATAYSAALLQDIGCLLFATLKPEQYRQLDPGMEDEAMLSAEYEIFGMAHPEAGFLLAESWNLPEDLCEAIRFHHDFPLAKRAPQLVATVQVAHTLLAARRGNADNVALFAAERCPEAIRCLGLSTEVLMALCGVIHGFAAA